MWQKKAHHQEIQFKYNQVQNFKLRVQLMLPQSSLAMISEPVCLSFQKKIEKRIKLSFHYFLSLQ